MTDQNNSKNELTITRIFDVPRERVWKAWTDPDLFMKWWGPKDFTCPSSKIDLRVGGKYLYCMQSPDGKKYWSTGTYREIIPMEKIVVSDSFADEKGKIVSSTYYGLSPGFPRQMQVTATFEEYDSGKTKFTLRYSGINGISDADRIGMEQGWNQSFDKLAENLANMR